MLEETLVVNPDSKIPLYLQLTDQIKDYITSGRAKEDEQLPPVNTLANKLGIHFETVRKAYKDLENDGLIAMKRGLGTFFNLSPAATSKSILHPDNGSFISEARELIMKSLKRGEYVGKILEDFQTALDEVSREFHGQKVVFTECNDHQTAALSDYLRQFLNCSFTPNHYIEVEGVLVNDLKNYLQKPNVLNGKFSVVTTGFHFDEVKKIVAPLPVNVHVIITSMSRESRRRLAAFDNETKYAFISQNQHIATVIMDILKEELGDVSIEYCSVDDKEKIKDLIEKVDAILAPPSVNKEIKELIPSEVPVIEVFDIVDPMSLKLLKDQLFSEYESLLN